MAESSNSLAGDESSNGSSNVDFWYDILLSNPNDAPTEQTSRLYQEWGHVYKESQKKDKKRKGTDVGSSSTVNSASDISEALSSISRDLSLSSSSGSSSSSGKTDEDTQKDDLKLQQGVDAVENHNLSLDNDLVHGSSVPQNENEIQTKGTFIAEEISQELFVPVPKVGMAFSSQEEAYEFYENYSRGIGFQVRKAKVQRLASGAIRKRFFFCSRQGFRSEKQYGKKTKYKRRETRTGCEARIQLTVEDGKWVISQFVERHNHPLSVPRSTIPSSKSLEVNAYKKDGKATKSVEIYKMGILSYVQKKEETNLRPEDAQSLINYLRQLQVEDPLFFNTFQLDSKCRVTNIFWRDGQSKKDYKIFGDVVILDTTLKAEKYDMICAAFLGINHHRQLIVYGFAFLLDESMETYIWLFETFVEAMGRQQPKTIFTDDSLEMGDAIKSVMPKTQQKLGLWCIMTNASKHLDTTCEEAVLRSLLYQSIFKCETEEEFKVSWKFLLEHLGQNPWVVNLHASREKWCPLFSKNSFTADIEYDYAFQDFTTEAASLSTLVQQYLDASKRLRQEELLEDCRCKEVIPWMMLENSSIEKQAAGEYTDAVLKIFQELRKFWVLEIEEFLSNGKVHVFKVIEIGKDDIIFCVVLNNGNDCTIGCSCKKFESVGILCAHALKVLEAKQILQIPHQYILRRWTKSARTSP